MTEDEMTALVTGTQVTRTEWWWRCPKCSLWSDIHDRKSDALEDLKYHINEDHKGED